jgi:hypothetical protein
MDFFDAPARTPGRKKFHTILGAWKTKRPARRSMAKLEVRLFLPLQEESSVWTRRDVSRRKGM